MPFGKGDEYAAGVLIPGLQGSPVARSIAATGDASHAVRMVTGVSALDGNTAAGHPEPFDGPPQPPVATGDAAADAAPLISVDTGGVWGVHLALSRQAGEGVTVGALPSHAFLPGNHVTQGRALHDSIHNASASWLFAVQALCGGQTRKA